MAESIETMETGALDLVGVIVANSYQLGGLLGSGGSSWVYRATDLRDRKHVALKIIARKHAGSSEMRTRFEREIRASTTLDHPNVVGVHDHGRHGERLFLAMELVEGASLAQLIADDHPLPMRLVLDLARQVADGLAHAHAHGFVHRDLKPGNIMVGSDGCARIVDFGLAIDAEPTSDERLTSEGFVVGTPEYVSPEQAYGGPLNQRSDLFSLGLVLYEMVTGRLPFDGSPGEIARKNAIGSVPPPQSRNPDIELAPALERLIFGLLERNPRRRPGAKEAARCLERLHKDIRRSSSAGRRPPSRKRQRRGPGVTWIAAAIACFVLLSMLVMSWRVPSADAQAPPAAGEVDVSARE